MMAGRLFSLSAKSNVHEGEVRVIRQRRGVGRDESKAAIHFWLVSIQ